MTEARPSVVEGEVIAGKYRIERVLGAGGMGVVVAAWHQQLNQRVALKFLRKDVNQTPETVIRFLREAQALARITSPHVARVMDVGTLEQGEPYLVMEYLHGSDLRAVLTDRGPLPIEEAVGYLLQAAEAIAEAHANGIVHRDLKPSNLFLTRGADGLPLIKVLDFGISKALEPEGSVSTSLETNTGALVGSPAYMSPEQIRDAKRVDARSDIWSLGVILHELVAGEPPFRGESVSGTLAAIAADRAPSIRALRGDVPERLEALILRCLEKNPEQRFASVAGFARALLDFAPSAAQAQVERVERLLGGSGNERVVWPSSSPPSPLSVTSATLPTWEGHTSIPRRPLSVPPAVIAFGVALLLLGGAALLLFRPNEPTPIAAANAAASGAGSSDALSSGTAGSAPVAPAPVALPAPALSARPNGVAARSKPAPAPAPAPRPLTLSNDDDGTNDRK